MPRDLRMESTILLIDKPEGITSFRVVARVRRLFGTRRVGHAGTLDPLASGLLIVGVGSGTKRLAEYQQLPKEYDATILLGEQTDTGDREGKVLTRRSVRAPAKEDVERVLNDMTGVLFLTVPIFAAVKQGGEPLYKKARRGEAVVPPERPMEVYEVELTGIEQHDEHCLLHVHFSVASGVYVRSLAEELGRRLGYPARLETLRRTRIGDFTIEDAVPLESLEGTAREA